MLPLFLLIRKLFPRPEYEIYIAPELCTPDSIDFSSGYWRCGHCGEECPMTCPVDSEDQE